MRSKNHIQDVDNVSWSSHVRRETPMSHLAENHEMFNYCLLTLAWIPPLRHQFGGQAPEWCAGRRVWYWWWWWWWCRGMKPLYYQLSLTPVRSFYYQRQSTSGITNDIMTIFHALQTSDVLPTHLLWYLVTDPAVNQGRVMGLEAHLLLSLANDLEGNRGCQCLQHVLHWQSSRAPSKTLSYKLCRSLRF